MVSIVGFEYLSADTMSLHRDIDKIRRGMLF